MSFRRIPFQFTATDPNERQQAIQRRFGFPVRDEMYVDFPNSAGMGSGAKESNSATNSPRLQHRVPIFVEGSDQPIKTSVDTQNNNAQSGRKPHVRVIPIEVEDGRSSRQRTYSGPAGIGVELPHGGFHQHKEPASLINRSMYDLPVPQKVKSPTGPRICNIPIQIERSNGKSSPDVHKKCQKTEFPVKSDVPKTNGCNVSRNEVKLTEKKPSQPDFSIPLKKIENILTELKTYQEGVENFTGTAKDKQYRYLDEMLTRCMLNLDDIDTMGNEQIRSARKAAVKNVQACIDLLESKINAVSSNVQDPVSEENVESCEVQEKESKKLQAECDVSAVKEQNKVDQNEISEGYEQDVEMEVTTAVTEVNMGDNEKSPNEADMNTKGPSNMEASNLDIIENKAEYSVSIPEVEMVEDDQILKNVDKFDVEMEENSSNQTDVKVIEECNMEPVEDNEPTSITSIQEKPLESVLPKPNQNDMEMDVKDTSEAKESSSDTLIKSQSSMEDSGLELFSTEASTKCHTSHNEIVTSVPNISSSQEQSAKITESVNGNCIVTSSEISSEPKNSRNLIEAKQTQNNSINKWDTNPKL